MSSEIWEFGPKGEEQKFRFKTDGDLSLSQPTYISLDLDAKPREVLVLLLKAKGGVLSHATLANPSGTPDSGIDEVDSARHSVAQIRKLLDPRGENQPIMTVRGTGYRFTWHVMRVTQQESATGMKTLPQQGNLRPLRSTRNAIKRPDTVASITDSLLATVNSETLTALTVAVGMGGVGKTMIAAMVMDDARVQARFPDGVIGITVGKHPQAARLEAELRQIPASLGREPSGWDLSSTRAQLERLFSNSAVLLVIDDVWDVRDVEWRPRTYGNSAILMTSQFEDIQTAIKGSSLIRVRLLDTESGLNLLAQTVQAHASQLPKEASAVLKHCGGLPFAITIAGCMVMEGAEWSDVLTLFRRSKVREVSAANEDEHFTNVADIIGASVTYLNDADLQRYLGCCIFPDDTAIPEAVFETLWKDETIARVCLNRLLKRSLLLGRENKSVTFHDLHLSYLRDRCGEKLAEYHNALVIAYRLHCSEDWSTGIDDGYFFQYLPMHLRSAGLNDELRSLLFDRRWIDAKLRATTPEDVAGDFNLLSNDPEAEELQAAIRFSKNVLAKTPAQLASQLHGRLEKRSHGLIGRLLADLLTNPGQPALLPLRPTLRRPVRTLAGTMLGHSTEVGAVRFIPDTHKALSAGDDGFLIEWDWENGHELRRFGGYSSMLECAVLLPGGDSAVGGDSDGQVHLWNLRTNEETAFETNLSHVRAIGLLRGGLLLAGGPGGSLNAWRADGTVARQFVGHQGSISALGVNSHGTVFASGDTTDTITIWSVANNAPQASFPALHEKVRALAFLPDNKRFVSTGSDGTIRVRTLDGIESACYDGHLGPVWALVVLPDGERIVSAGSDGTIRLWPVQEGQQSMPLVGHTGKIYTLDRSRDGKTLLSAGEDATVRVWDLEQWRQKRVLGRVPRGQHHEVGRDDEFTDRESFTAGIQIMALLPASQTALLGGGDGVLRLWDLQSGKQLRHSKPVGSRFTSLLVDRQNGSIFVGTADGRIIRWSAQLEKEKEVLCQKGPIWSLAYANALADLLFFATSKSLWSMIVSSGEVRSCSAREYEIIPHTMIPSADGSELLWAERDGRLHRGRVTDLQSSVASEPASSSITSISLIPDTDLALTGHDNGIVSKWDCRTMSLKEQVQAAKGRINAVSVIAGAPYVLIAADDRVLRLQAVGHLNEIARFNMEGSGTLCEGDLNRNFVMAVDASDRLYILEMAGFSNDLPDSRPST